MARSCGGRRESKSRCNVVFASNFHALVLSLVFVMPFVLQAGKNLIVLEVNSDLVCESGLDEEPELHWSMDKKKHENELWEKCKAIKHVFQRTARECTDIRFLSLTVSRAPPFPLLQFDSLNLGRPLSGLSPEHSHSSS